MYDCWSVPVVIAITKQSLCKNLESLITSLYFASSDPDFPAILYVLSCKASPGLLTVIQSFYLDIGCFVHSLLTQSLQLPVKCRPMFFVTFFVLIPLTLTYESIEHKKGHLMPGLDFCRESLTLYFDFISLFVSNRKVAVHSIVP